MTATAQISQRLDSIERNLSQIMRLLKQETTKEEWLSADQVQQLYPGCSKETLRKMRSDGTLDKDEWKARGGRNHRYLKSAIDKLYK